MRQTRNPGVWSPLELAIVLELRGKLAKTPKVPGVVLCLKRQLGRLEYSFVAVGRQDDHGGHSVHHLGQVSNGRHHTMGQEPAPSVRLSRQDERHPWGQVSTFVVQLLGVT